MARIGVLHNTLDFRGGADAVCVHTCAALADAHDVTLFTISAADPEDVAAQFDVELDVKVAEPPGAAAIASGFSAIAPYTGPQLAARTALIRAFFMRHADDFDMAVSTTNELSLPIPSVQYVHFPQFHLNRTPTGEAGRFDRVWNRVAAPTQVELDRDVRLLANSSWTADVVADIYGHRPAVCHPPVDPIEGEPWADRNPGIVILGRIAPDKRTLDAIRVVDGLRDASYDVHCTVVGSAPAAYREYVGRVRDVVAERSYVTLETDVSRQRVRDLLGRNRYGLNVKPNEHFGMAVAEYIAAGMLAFAPDTGGQVDVLNGNQRQLFGDIDEAIDLLGEAIDAGWQPTDDKNHFGREQFADEMRDHVETLLSRC